MTTFPPTTETNARAIAAGKGYRLDTDPDGCVVAIGIADGLRYAAALSWHEMLSWVLAAPKLGDGAK